MKRFEKKYREGIEERLNIRDQEMESGKIWGGIKTAIMQTKKAVIRIKPRNGLIRNVKR